MGGWGLGEGGVVVCRCEEGFSAHELALAAQQKWRSGEWVGLAFAWLMDLPKVALTAWQRYEVAAVFREALTAKTLPGAVVVHPADREWFGQLAWDLAKQTGGVLGVFQGYAAADDWIRQQVLAFIAESCWRVRQLANTLHKPVLLPPDF